VAVLFDVGFLVGVFLVLADSENGEDRVEEGARAAEEAEQEEQEYAEDDADDDTGNGAAREAAAAAGHGLGRACSASGDGCLEGDGRGGGARVRDYDES
jgi:hypothetical protein